MEIKLFLVVWALFCNLIWFSRTFREYFSSKFMYIVPVAQTDSKNILRMFSRIRPDCRIMLTPPERAWFSAYSLFEQIPFGMNRDILKHPTLCGAKNSNKLCVPSHLVTWIPHTVRCSSSLSYISGFVLLFVPHFFFFGKAVLRDCSISWVSSLIFFSLDTKTGRLRLIYQYTIIIWPYYLTVCSGFHNFCENLWWNMHLPT